MNNMKNKNILKEGFTLIELLIVIAIIGILSGVVMMSTTGGVDKAKQASATTTLSSILPELVTCQDDGFGINQYDTTKTICNDTGTPVSHTAKWPDVFAKTGFTVTAPSAANSAIAAYQYSATKSGVTVTCSFSDNSCN